MTRVKVRLKFEKPTSVNLGESGNKFQPDGIVMNWISDLQSPTEGL